MTWFLYDDDDEYSDLEPGQTGLHEEEGEITFVEWVDQDEGIALVEMVGSLKTITVYIEDCVFE